MPSLAQAAKPVLPGWGYFTQNEVDAANTQNEHGQQFLHDMQAYDPTAHWEHVRGEGGGEGGNATNYSHLVYDPTKLPGGNDRPAMVDMNEGAFNGMYNDGAQHGYAGNLFNNDAVGEDRNGFGRTTSPRNLNLAADHHSWVDTYGPMIVMALATMGGSLAAGGAGMFSGGGLGAGGNMATGLVNGARALDNGGGLESLLPSLLSLGGQAMGAPSWASSGASTLARVARRDQRPGG